MAEKDLAFAKRLEKYMEEAGFTKKKLADGVGVSPSAVGAYINEGRIPEAPILLKIARLLNKTIEDLLTGESVPYIIAPEVRYSLKEDCALYHIKGDADIHEIVELLEHDLPEVKKYLLKFLRGTKERKEGAQGLGLPDPKLTEEG